MSHLWHVTMLQLQDIMSMSGNVGVQRSAVTNLHCFRIVLWCCLVMGTAHQCDWALFGHQSISRCFLWTAVVEQGVDVFWGDRGSVWVVVGVGGWVGVGVGQGSTVLHIERKIAGVAVSFIPSRPPTTYVPYRTHALGWLYTGAWWCVWVCGCVGVWVVGGGWWVVVVVFVLQLHDSVTRRNVCYC